MAVKLTIWHTYESGTILSGTSKGDVASNLLGSRQRGGLGWKWSSHIITPGAHVGAWYVRMSRDKPAKLWEINQAVTRLRQAGYEVDVHIDNAPRDMATSEAERAARIDDRATALEAKAARRADQATAKREQADTVFRGIPLGQPYLVGHYSYPADRNRRERAWNNVGKSIELREQAAEIQRRAATAQQHMDLRTGPMAVARRIRTLETQLRRWERERAGGDDWVWNEATGQHEYRHVDPSPAYAQRCDDQIAHVTNHLTYWRDVRAHQVATGAATNYGPDDITKGDHVRHRGHWFEVVRVNKKSVTANTFQGSSGAWFTSTIPYDQIRDVRKPPSQQSNNNET